MGASKQFLSSKEFAARSGLPVSKVTKLLRAGGLKGQKKGRQWMIPASELDPLQGTSPPAPRTAAAPQPVTAARPGQSYSVAEFSAMTYLTEFGVCDWLRKGRLQGTRSDDGEWRIDAANLEAPHMKNLVR
ncbi:MAG: helix-turn-helix domain-containing protein [Desulfobacterales bacterium]|nr:helix-turn-helix domain-containing protein [Desulfobacterales bacterium]